MRLLIGKFYRLDALHATQPTASQHSRDLEESKELTRCREVPTLVRRLFSTSTPVSRYQNVSILDFTGAKDGGDGGDNWKLSPPVVTAKLQSNRHHQQTIIQLVMPLPRRH